MKRLTGMALTLIAAFAAPAGVAAGETMALIVDGMGAISPPALSLTEAESGARFELEPDAALAAYRADWRSAPVATVMEAVATDPPGPNWSGAVVMRTK